MSVLEPNSNINPHQGDTDAVIRCHLALKIPGPLPDCGFQVENEIRGWEEGVTLPFCDARSHTAWNHTGGRRYIMILDVIRPEYKNRINEVCTHILASAGMQMLYQRYDWLRRRPHHIKKILYHTARLFMYLYIPLQRLSFKF